MRLLHLDSSVTGQDSVSRRLTARVAQAWRASHPEGTVVYRDLVASPLPHWQPQHGSSREASALAQQLIQEVRSADALLLGAPMYNFSIPTQLKAWLDHLAVPQETFSYGSAGPVGLLQDRPTVIVSTRGGRYSEGATMAMDHQESYLQHMLAFLGIRDVRWVRAEGLGMAPLDEAQVQASIAAAWSAR